MKFYNPVFDLTLDANWETQEVALLSGGYDADPLWDVDKRGLIRFELFGRMGTSGVIAWYILSRKDVIHGLILAHGGKCTMGSTWIEGTFFYEKMAQAVHDLLASRCECSVAGKTLICEL